MLPDLGIRFAYHPATTSEKREAHQRVRDECLCLADWLNSTLPDGREKSLAITKLEEVMFWANGAIARDIEGR